MKKIPQRMCIACREMKDKSTLLRCRVNADGGLEIDRTGKGGGRGAYICNNRDCVIKAKKYNLFNKALGVCADDDFYNSILTNE